MNIVGKFFPNLEGFQPYVEALPLTSAFPLFTVVHNSSVPDLALYAEWLAHPERHGHWTHEQWLRNLGAYYSSMGWHAGPHAFVCPDGVGLLTPLTQPGTHSPSWNSKTWGIETVGEFDRESFGGPVRNNLIQVLAVLHRKSHLDPAAYVFGKRGLHLHKEDPVTTHKSCPGKLLDKPELVSAVRTAIGDAPLLKTIEPSDVDDMLDEIAKGMSPGDKLDVPISAQEADTAHMSDDDLKTFMRGEVRRTLIQPEVFRKMKIDLDNVHSI